MEANSLLIFGASPIAYALAGQLDPGRVRFLVEMEEEAAALQAEGFEAVCIDISDDEALTSHGVGDGVSVAYCFFPSVATNVYMILSLRELSSALTIVAYGETDENRQKLLIAGADHVIDPYAISANRIEAFMHRPYVADVLDSTIFSHSDIKIMEMTIDTQSDLVGTQAGSISSLRSHNLILVGVIDRQQGDDFLFTSANKTYHLDPGDILVLVGHHHDLVSFKEAHRLR